MGAEHHLELQERELLSFILNQLRLGDLIPDTGQGIRRVHDAVTLNVVGHAYAGILRLAYSPWFILLSVKKFIMNYGPCFFLTPPTYYPNSVYTPYLIFIPSTTLYPYKIS